MVRWSKIVQGDKWTEKCLILDETDDADSFTLAKWFAVKKSEKTPTYDCNWHHCCLHNNKQHTRRVVFVLCDLVALQAHEFYVTSVTSCWAVSERSFSFVLSALFIGRNVIFCTIKVASYFAAMSQSLSSIPTVFILRWLCWKHTWVFWHVLPVDPS